jgi:hypothetical protein
LLEKSKIEMSVDANKKEKEKEKGKKKKEGKKEREKNSGLPITGFIGVAAQRRKITLMKYICKADINNHKYKAEA